MRIPCTCGCGQQVTYTTKQSHLNGHGKTVLRARILAENEWLRQRQDHPKEGSKKRSHSTSDKDGNHKWSKTVQLGDEVPKIFRADPDIDPDLLSALVPNQGPEVQADTDLMDLPGTNQLQLSEIIQADTDSMDLPGPNQSFEIIQADTDPMDPPGPNQSSEVIQTDADLMDLLDSAVPNQPEIFQADIPSPLPNNIELDDTLPDVLSSKPQLSKERIGCMLEQCWGNSHLEDKYSGNGGGDDSSGDEAEDDGVNPALEIGDDEDSGEDSVGDDDVDTNNSFFAESDIAGISAWDLLGEGFECEAATIG